MKSVLIRCDANDLNGYGHLSRCLNIARGIREYDQKCTVTFIGEYSSKAVSLIEKYDLKFIAFPMHDSESAQNVIPFLKNCDYFLLDSYKITQNYINELTGRAFKFCLIADDSTVFDFSNADLVINYAINGEEFDYKSKKQALGLKYFPVKPELKKVREKNLHKKKRDLDRLLLMIGGHDIYSVGVKILKIMDSLVSNKKITFISASIQSNHSVKNNELKIFPFVEKMETVFDDTDLTITGGGLSKYESVYCGIPNACIPQNINEYKDSLHFEANKLTRIIGKAYEYDERTVASNVSDLFSTKEEVLHDLFHTDSLTNLVNVILN